MKREILDKDGSIKREVLYDELRLSSKPSPPKPGLKHWMVRKFRVKYWRTMLARPEFIRDSIAKNVWHFVVRGALIGINQQIDPVDLSPRRGGLVLAACGAILAVSLSSGTLQLGFILVIVCPMWFVTLAAISDPVVENRAYFVLWPIGLIAASIAATGSLGGLLLPVFAWWWLKTLERNGFWASRYRLWERASKESPANLRAYLNFTVALSKSPGKIDAAIDRYEWMVTIDDPGNRKIGTAHSNLSLLYRTKAEQTGDNSWVDKAAALMQKAVENFPDHARVRLEAGVLFMGFSLWNEALAQLDKAIELEPKFAEAIRNRATVWGRFGELERTKADIKRAEALDGLTTNINFVDEPAAKPGGSKLPTKNQKKAKRKKKR